MDFLSRRVLADHLTQPFGSLDSSAPFLERVGGP
jgi:hypothetical protein